MAFRTGPTTPEAGLAAGTAAQPSQRLVDAARDFEGVFISQMLHSMTDGTSGDGLLGNGSPMGGMMADEYAKLISRSGGIGVADAVLRELMRIQEAG
jgi:Rod binding domain-containing protein